MVTHEIADKTRLFKNFRSFRNNMKALIDISRSIWGKVKDFATVEDLSLNSAVESLITEALKEHGYFLQRKEEDKE